MSSPKLFLKQNSIDGKFKVVDENDFPFGDAYEIPDAIKSARTVTDKPIDIEDNYAGISRLVVSEKPKGAIIDKDMFIAALAEIGGMKVNKYYDDNLNFLGYGMELVE